MSYRIAQFAKLAGVTVRTLQYYDRQGLLKPAKTTASGYRLYERQDLLRLQQILTLKWMGFALNDIGVLLDDPNYDLGKALTLQQQAVEAQIERLQRAAQALAEAQQLLASPIETLSSNASLLQTILKAVHPLKDMLFDWQQHYSETAVASLQSRSLTMDAQTLASTQHAWQALYDAFDQHRHLPPTAPLLQKLAAQMNRLVEEFTQGDAEIRQGLEKTYANRDSFPQQYQFGDPALQTLMQQALTIYLENKR